mgnify:CR=1 FL=1
MPFVKSNRLRAIAVLGAKRTQVAPEIPTAVESGLKDYIVDGWFAALAPAKTPDAVLARLNDEVVRAVTCLHT